MHHVVINGYVALEIFSRETNPVAQLRASPSDLTVKTTVCVTANSVHELTLTMSLP